jgi:antirestriction protein
MTTLIDLLPEDVQEAIDRSGLPAEAIVLFADNQHAEIDGDVIMDAEDAYLGSAWSVREWAEEWANDTGILHGIPEDLRNYFDYDAWVRDATLSGDIYILAEPDGYKHVFHN